MTELLQSPITFLLIALTSYTSWLYFKLPYEKQLDMLFFPYEVYRGRKLFSILSSIFVHSSWEHLIFNMLSLYLLGSYVEYQIGAFVFICLYFLSGFFGDLALLLKYKDNRNYCSLGASGATSGIVFGFIALNPFEYLQIILIPIAFPAYIFGILYLGISYFQSKRSNDMIAHEAHIGGAISGAVFMFLLYGVA